MILKNKFACLLLFSTFLLAFNCCKKGEIAINKISRVVAVSGDTNIVNSGVVITSTIEMGSDYKQQIFYSLSYNKIISSNLKTDWDLGFESGINGYHIKLNGAKAMSAFNTNQTNFASVTDTIGMKAAEKVDSPTGNADSTAFGNWQTNTPVYIMSRGYNELGVHQGFRKIQFLSVNQTHYTLKIANLNGSNETTASILKDETKNHTYFSLTNNGVVNIEPGKEDYDLLFSQYTHVYSNPYSTYLVTGVSLNPNKVKVALITDKPFADIVISDSINHPFKTTQNGIGYYWKTFNFSTSSYTVDANMCFLLKDTKGFYYKLHFVDFYNTLGIKGFPKWEYQKL